MKINRRTLLKSACYASSLSCLSPINTFAAMIKQQDIHLRIAEQAQKLNNGVPLRLLYPEGSLSNIEAVTQLFTLLTDVKIELTAVQVDDINTEMFLSHNIGDHRFDIALPTTFGIPDLAEAGVITDLTSLREQHEPSGFQDSALYTLGDFYNNNFYGYQVDGDVYVTFYNQLLVTGDAKKRFSDQFGHEYRTPQTWEDLDEHMAHFHQPEKNQYGGVLFRNSDYLAWEFWMRFHAQGILPLADDLTPQLSSDKGVLALESMINASQYLSPNARSNGLVDNWKDYAKGNIYANIGWGGSQKYFQRNAPIIQNNLLYSAAPGIKTADGVTPLSYFNWGWNYTVPAGSKQKELAFLYTLFAVCPSPSTLSVQASDGFFDPYRIEHYDDEKIQETYSKEFLHEHRIAMRNCIPDFYIQGQSLYFSELKKHLELALNGDISPKQALTFVDKSWLLLHKKFDSDKLHQQWQGLLKRYPANYLKITHAL